VDLIEKLRRVGLIRHKVICLAKSAIFGWGCIALTILLNFFSMILNAQSAGIIVHDPVMIRQEGIYHLFCTGKGITEFTSPDMINWEYEGPVFDAVPAWTRERVHDFEGHIWAPDISFHQQKYLLYYSISSFAKNTSCIGLATNKTLDRKDPQYHWIDRGVVIQSVPGKDQWNAIDPNLMVDDQGIPWLVFGSFWEGIKLVKLDSEYSIPAEPQVWYTLARRKRDFEIPERNPGNGAIEAPFLFRRNNYYYLFVSFDYCCRGINSDYKIMVGRSENITGPYFDKLGNDLFLDGGSLVLEGNSDWPGVGHNAVSSFDGVDYLIFHAYDAADEGRPKLLIRKIIWDDAGWPFILLKN
jgi:arabinan endo-1,5-alpha-L-arabinosidase